MTDQSSFHVSVARENSALSRTQSVCSVHGLRPITRLRSLDQPATLEKEQELLKERFNKSFHGFRYIVVIMAGLSVGFMMFLRLGITVAIIKMVNQTQIYLEEHPDNADLFEYFGEDYVEEGEFAWNNERQQLIISYYMITYTLPQFFAAKLSLEVGSRLAIPISLSICLISTVLIPIVAYWGWEWVLVMRLMNGLGAAAVIPNQLNLLEKWMPQKDLTLGLTIATLLQCSINALGLVITGYLASFHWTYAFYGPGLIILAFSVLWLILISDGPSDNWFISEKELSMICNCANHSETKDSHNCSDENSKQDAEKASGNQEKSVSLLDIFCVPIFYVYLVLWCLYCGSVNCYTFALSNYLRQYLKIKISMNGLYASIITAGSIIAIAWPHPTLKILQSKLKMSVIGSRCLVITVTCTITAMTWIYVGLFHDNQLLVFFLHRCFFNTQDVLITASLMNNFTGVSSIVYSVMNTVGNATALPGAALIGYVLDYTGQSDLAWTWILITLGITQLMTILVYCSFIHTNPIQISRKGHEKDSIEGKDSKYSVKNAEKIRKLSDQSINIHATIAAESFSLSRTTSICSIHDSRRCISSIKQQVEPQVEPQQPLKERFNKSFHGCRYIVAVMAGLCIGFMMLLRLNITVALIKMVNQTHIYLEEHPDNADLIEYFGEDYVEEGEFAWNNERQQLIISFYMITYTLPQFFTTKLAIRIGSRYALFISLLICSLSTLITPVAAYWGWKWVLVLRLIQGLGASSLLPMMLNVIENWMPYDEMSIGLTTAQLLQATIIAGNPLFVGYLASYHWKYTFYVTGLIVLVYCALWLILVTDHPTENWLVSEKELNLICNCIDSGKADRKSCKEERELDLNEASPGILSAFRVPSFYAYSLIWILYCGASGCFPYILPAYLRQFLKIDVTLNGFYCFLIQSGGLIAVIWPHPILRILQTKCNLSLTGARRVINAGVVVIVAASWVYVGIFHQAQLILLFINRAFHQSNDVVVMGSLMSNFSKSGLSSVVFSVVNTFGNLTILFASPLIGYVLDYTGQSEAAWGWIFSLFGITQILGTIAFCTIIRSDPIDLRKKTVNETKGSINV